VETLEERLRRELQRLSPPGDPSGVVDQVLRKAARHHTRRGAGIVLLTLSVIAGSIAGFYALSRVFGDRDGGRIGSPAPPNGAIAFVVYGPSEDPSIPDGSTIFAVNPDGSDRVELTRAEGVVTDLDWSPDGRRLVYGRHDLFVLDLDSGLTTRVVVPGTEGYGASWSPDGSQIALAVAQPTGYAIYTMRPDGSDTTLLTEGQDLGRTDWSPDGTRILFVGPGPEGAYQGWDIYVMNADGSDVTNLTNSPTVDLDPNWSPDGSTILFRSRRDPPPGWTNGDAPDELYLMAPDGSDVRRLTIDDATDQSPVWSPDGTRIAFTSATPNGDTVVYTMRPDGTDKIKLPGVSATVTVIAWQPLTTDGTVTPEPSPGESVVPEPTPAERPSADAGEDIGLGFPVCNVSSVPGVFGPGISGSAFVGTKGGETGCPRLGDGFQLIAVDVSGDGLADASYGPLECDDRCSAFAAPDIDGDGIDEVAVAVGSTGGSTLFEVFRVAGETIQRLGFDCSRCNEGTFAWGGPGGHVEGAYCLPEGSMGDFVTWAAVQADDGIHYEVVEIFIDVKGAFLVEIEQRDSSVPYERSALPAGGGDEFCGAPAVSAPTA
jgi:hypothetical protein